MNAVSIRKYVETGPLALAIVAMPFSIFFCHLGLVLFAVQWIWQGAWTEKWRLIRKNPFVFFYLFFFLLHAIGVFYSQDRHSGWFDVEKKIAFAALPILVTSSRLGKAETEFLLKVFIATCILASLVCIALAIRKTFLHEAVFNFDAYTTSTFYDLHPGQANGWLYFSYLALSSTIGIHPAYLSLYLTFAIILLIHFYEESFWTSNAVTRVALLSVLILMVVMVLLLSSRIIIIALLMIPAFGTLTFFRRERSRWQWAGALLAGLLMIGFLYLNPVSRFRCFEEIASTWPFNQSGLQTQSTTIRASLWSMSLKSLPSVNPFIGTGTGDVQHTVHFTSEKNHVSNVLNTYDPHNQYLQTLIGLGYLGLASLLACFFAPAYVALRQRYYLYLAFVLLFCLLCVTETALELQKGIVYFSLFNSLLLFKSGHLDFEIAQPAK